MKCYVCFAAIRINRFQELLSLQEPILCSRCQSHLKRKSANILFENNEWLETVIRRLNQGDVCLNKIFFQTLKASILKHLNVINEIVVLDSKSSIPYPWLEILVVDIKDTLPKRAFKGEKTLYITEKASSESGLMISLR